MRCARPRPGCRAAALGASKQLANLTVTAWGVAFRHFCIYRFPFSGVLHHHCTEYIAPSFAHSRAGRSLTISIESTIQSTDMGKSEEGRKKKRRRKRKTKNNTKQRRDARVCVYAYMRAATRQRPQTPRRLRKFRGLRS